MGEVLMVRDHYDYEEILQAKKEYEEQGIKTRIYKTIEGYKLVEMSRKKKTKEKRPYVPDAFMLRFHPDVGLE